MPIYFSTFRKMSAESLSHRALQLDLHNRKMGTIALTNGPTAIASANFKHRLQQTSDSIV